MPDLKENKKSNFYFSFLFLPRLKREAIEIVYAFCRHTDDIVDEQNDDHSSRFQRLLRWTLEVEKAVNGSSPSPFLRKVAAVITRFNIPIQPFLDLIKGMEMDLVKTRYETYEELDQYCYRAASTVGLICAEIFGYRNRTARTYAVLLGKALQLTNILRDIKQDAKKGRIYIPQEDLDRFGYSEEELLNGVMNDNFRALMRYECERARSLYRLAGRTLHDEDKPLFAMARAMGTIYYRLLLKIEANNYDVFTRRIHLSLPFKFSVALLLGIRNLFPFSIQRRLPRILPV